MLDYIFTTREEISKIIREVIADLIPKKEEKPYQITDTLNLNSLLELLSENGCDCTKSSIYKMTSNNEIPYMKFGSRLVFSRKDIIEWLHAKTILPVTTDDAAKKIRDRIRK